MKENNLFLKTIAVLSVIMIIFIVGFTFGKDVYRKSTGPKKEEGFIEVYFKDPEGLTKNMSLGENYTIPVVLKSHESTTKTYTYTINEGENVVDTGTVSLNPKETKTLNLLFKPTKKTWKTSRRTKTMLNEFKLPVGKTFIGKERPVKKEYTIDGTPIIVDTGEVTYDKKIKFDLDVLPGDLFTELNLEREGNYSVVRSTDVTETLTQINTTKISIQGDKLIVEHNVKDLIHTLDMEKCTITISSPEGKEYSIHFWFSVR